ncbi:hypothetical protein BDW22DRAFT_1009332 [Trametopsis cervina]|nr:hypothetical protein BDW22DRAFT_1009332 [Trametopsis cervina]
MSTGHRVYLSSWVQDAPARVGAVLRAELKSVHASTSYNCSRSQTLPSDSKMLDWMMGTKDKHKHKEKEATPDDLARHMAAMTLAAGRPSRRKSANDFVGGFYGEHSPDKRDTKREKPLPATPNNVAFPQPVPHFVATRPGPGPLPVPPRMRMPEPEPNSRPGNSITYQYAQGLWDGNLHGLATLSPPQADMPPRASSDPSVPIVSESISAHIPTTTKRNRIPQQLSVNGQPSDDTRSRPERKRSASTPVIAQTASAVSFRSGSVQCSALTQQGNRCKKAAKVSSVLSSVLGDDEDDGAIEAFCTQHKDKALEKKEFLSPVSGEYIKYEDYIPSYLDRSTQAALRSLMTKMATKADRPGYIYGFEILDTDPAVKDCVFFKVGRTVKLNKRMHEWAKQCGSKSQHLRGRWPEMPGDDTPDLMGRLQEGTKGKFCYRLERLIHVELADLAQNNQYLLSGFPSVSPDFSDNGSPRTKSKEPCGDCGKVHKEIFTFKRAKRGRYNKREWDLIVKPIIHKWGQFVEDHVVQAKD